MDPNGGKSAKRDAYEVLGISRSASNVEIKKAYRKAAMTSHPGMCALDDLFDSHGTVKIDS